PLSLHDALPISGRPLRRRGRSGGGVRPDDPVHPLHLHVQRDRPALRERPAALDARGAAGRRHADGPHGGGGDSAVPLGPAGEGPPVGGAASPAVGRLTFIPRVSSAPRVARAAAPATPSAIPPRSISQPVSGEASEMPPVVAVVIQP